MFKCNILFSSTDVDECSDAALNNCTSGSECENTDGSFSCPCLDGYDETDDGLL